MDENMLLNLALDAGELMLANGAETYRVEDTIERILLVGGNCMPEAFVTTTGLFAGVNGDLTGSITKFKRVSKRSTNLEKVTRVNSMSRNFVNKKINIQEAFAELERIHSLPVFPLPLVILSYGIACSAFTLMFNGTILDWAGAFIVGIFLGLFVNISSTHNVSVFIVNILGGALITLGALGMLKIGLGTNYNNIIIGTMMPLVPGVALTNAIRDIMEGNYLSGTCRIVEAILVAISIASGVGVTLKLYGVLLGGL